jgi:uncharacterized protein (TIGR02687 family)
MDSRQIETALRQVFEIEGARIVFWNDPEREFVATQQELALPGIQSIDLATFGALELKVRLEREDPQGRYLLYSATEEPELEDDWLLDIRLYSRSFRADRASILLDELGLSKPSLRAHIAKRRRFFDNKDRVQRLRTLVATDDTTLDLDRKMLAVVVKADQPDLPSIVRTLFHSMVDEDGVDLDQPPEVWHQIEKFELDTSFWELVGSDFGYRQTNPSLHTLLIRLLTSDFLHQVARTEKLAGLDHLRLPVAGTHKTVVCLGLWRDSSTKASSYNTLALAVEAKLNLREALRDLEFEDLQAAVTFPAIDIAILARLAERVSASAESIDTAAIRQIASRRQANHWAASISVPEARRRALNSSYEAIALAAELFERRRPYLLGFDFADAAAMYRAYEKELYRFDQLHRQICWHADAAAAHGWDVLKSLRSEVETLYRRSFLDQLGTAWGKFIEGGLLDHWRLSGVPNQYSFYAREVGKRLDESERRRIFVIVSDALRYEVAAELAAVLNGAYRLETTLSSQLGVLPSYTRLGMASLLPHQNLEYTAKGDVLVDGKSTSSFENRVAILHGVGGLAVRAADLMNLNKEEGRAMVEDKRVVYVYHDEIDSRGEKAATEGDTFEACHQAILDLVGLVRHIINSLNGNHVLITADHGFLFSALAPNQTDRSALADKPPGTVVAKKRYLLGQNLPPHAAAWRGQTAKTALARGEMEFWIPKGTNLFHFTGGARFVHGGAMLQEIVVPLLTVRHVKDKSNRTKTQTREVSVQVLGERHIITTPRHRFRIIQTEPVSDRVKPLTLKVAVYDGLQPVTSIETVTFSSTSSNLDERQQWVTLVLENRAFDRKRPYRLVLRNAYTDVEQSTVNVTIDRAITNDFDL